MDFQTVLDIVKRRRWLIATGMILGLLVASYLFYVTPRAYSATAQIMVVRAGSFSNATANDIQSLAVSTNVIAAVKKDISSGLSIDALKGNVTAKTTFGSNVVQLTFVAYDRRTAVAGANAEAYELAKYYREIAGGRLSEVSGYLQKQLDAKRADLMAVDRKLQQASIQSPYNADGNAVSTISQQILALEQQRDSLQATLIGDQANASAQARHLREIAPIVTQEKTLNDPLYQQMRAQEAKDAASLALLQSEYTKYPGTPGLEAQVRKERQQLAAEQKAITASPAAVSASYTQALTDKGQIDAKLAEDNARLIALSAQVATAEDALAAVPGMGVRVADLRRQRDIVQTEYLSLAQRFGDVVAGQAQEANVGSVDVIDRARSSFSTIDKHSLMAILGSVFGFAIFGAVLAFLLELLDGRVRTNAAVENLYGRPVLGTVTPE
jgi:uncharacterized protein involved in exopolysaccharide biosynthesis